MRPRTKTKSVLTVTLLCGFFLATAGLVFAADDTTQSTVTGASNVIKDVIHVSNTYTAAGVQLGSTQTETKTTTTAATVKSGTAADVKTSSTTTSVSTIFSAFMGGSIKTIYQTSSTNTTGTDGSYANTTGRVDYTYNPNGQLKSAIGSSDTSGGNGKDAKGEDTGTYTSHTDDTYTIKNGEALLTTSVTTRTDKGVPGADGKDITTTSKDTVTYSYAAIAGTWQMTQMVDVAHTSGTDTSSSDITKTTNYTRSTTTGLITSVTQTATGKQVAIDSLGGSMTRNMESYNAVYKKDTTMGWYLQSETYDWVGK